jgi:hypothetical protein
MNATPADRAIERMQCKAATLEADRARLSTAMWGIYQEAGFQALAAAVFGELQRMAAKLGPGATGGWIG